jgi:hypothetical protein
MTDERYVTFGRWDEAHQSNLRRLSALEEFAREMSGAETAHESIKARITDLEEANKAVRTGEQGRRDRLWIIVIGLMTGIVCPLAVTTIITWLHLKSLH